MGNSESSSPDPRFVSATRAFTQNEVEDLKSLFQSLALQSQSNAHFISPRIFQAYTRIHGLLSERLFDLVTQKRKDQKLTFEDLVIAKATYEKGTKDEIEHFIYELLDITDDGIVGRSDLEAVLSGAFDYILPSKHCEPGSNKHEGIIDIYLNAATFTKEVEGCENGMSFEDFKSWLTLIPSLRKFLGSLLMPPNQERPGSQVPSLLHSETIDPSLIVLRKEYAWHIGGALSPQELVEWKLLYHSSVNGLSFNSFLGSVLNAEGPTVLIVKDTEGHIYGGYASQPWERHGDFYGDMKSFIFQLYPKASLFRPTGANNNIQWCAVNFSSESIPNGFGFGGQVNHLGLFLASSFDEGHTFACTTFGSPCLSKANRINPEVIECWAIGHQEKADTLKGSVLERFKEDRHLLNMVGLANSSE